MKNILHADYTTTVTKNEEPKYFEEDRYRVWDTILTRRKGAVAMGPQKVLNDKLLYNDFDFITKALRC